MVNIILNLNLCVSEFHDKWLLLMVIERSSNWIKK